MLKNEVIDDLKLKIAGQISTLSLALWIRMMWVIWIKKETLDVRSLVLIQICQAAIAFGTVKILQSKAGTTLVKAWVQEPKKLLGMTMVDIIGLAALDFANGIHKFIF